LVLFEAGARWWSDLPEDGRARASSAVWALADPLLLVPGNDLLTEHWSRRTYALVRERALNPYGMRWGSDLEELLVRYGAEVGWEREAGSIYDPPGPIGAVGHWHPESRELMPPGDALRDPAGSGADAWTPDPGTARSSYAPAYAPVLLPGAGPIAVFPRGDRIVVVGAPALPEDTSYHAGHAHPARDSVPPPWHGRPDEAGLFLLFADEPTRAPLAVRREGGEGAGLMVEAPAGRWVVSLETLSPARRRAGRTRVGLDRPALPPDVLTLSDLLLVGGALPADASLADAAARALPRAWVRAGERFGVAWELFGLGYADEVLSYRLTVGKDEEGFLRRAVRALRLVGPERRESLEWEEAAPERPGPALRSVEVELPPLEPGRYRLRLEVLTRGRAPLVRELPIELRDEAPSVPSAR
jgi:hypothetical protein